MLEKTFSASGHSKSTITIKCSLMLGYLLLHFMDFCFHFSFYVIASYNELVCYVLSHLLFLFLFLKGACAGNVCPWSGCGKIFSSAASLKIHRRIHAGEKPFKCHFCPYACSASGTLKIHLRVLTGEKPFKCYFCSYACTQKGSLKKHLERIHFKCSGNPFI
jgi:uncharacterized Zn-finger protein